MRSFDCPCDAILHDLSREMREWQDEGDHVIVLTDFNDDVTAATARTWATQLGLVEALTWLTPGAAPPTYLSDSLLMFISNS